MRIIASIIFTVFALDFFLAAVFFQSALPFLFGVGSLALVYVVLRSSRPRVNQLKEKEGWVLGEAMELTDPDHPVSCPRAVLSPQVLNLGVITIGAPGSGKTESVLLNQIRAIYRYSPGSGWAVFEGKGDIDIYKKCVAMGAKPTHFFSSELPGSDSINLMAGETHDVIDRLSTLLIGYTATTSFYSDEQRAVLLRVLPLLLNIGRPANLRDLYVVLSVEDAGRELVRQAQEAGLDPIQIELAKEWLEMPIARRIKNVAGLLNRIHVFISGPYAERLHCYQPDIDIGKTAEEGRSLYCHLPLTQFSKDIAIALISMFEVAARKRQMSGTEALAVFPILFDDWSGFFHHGFASFSARCRSASMPLSFGFQSRAHLEEVSPTFADALDDTIATKIVMRVQGSATAEYAMHLLGEYEAPEISKSDSGPRTGINIHYTRRARLDPRLLRELDPGEAYVSALTVREGELTSPLWKVRFALPDFSGWREVPMPAPKSYPQGEGLNFWDLYMEPGVGKKIQHLIKKVVEEKEEEAFGRGRP